MAEWVVGDASLDIASDAAADLLRTVLHRAMSLATAQELAPEQGRRRKRNQRGANQAGQCWGMSQRRELATV